jgi:hypothetical protein
MMRKLRNFALLGLLVLLFAGTVLATDGSYLYSGTTGQQHWYLYADGTLDIQGSGYLPGGYAGSNNWRQYADQITTIVVGEGITELSTSVFDQLPALHTVSLPSTLEKAGTWAFNRCTALEQVTFAPGAKEIGTRMFENCTNLRTVTVGSGIQTVGEGAFSGCTSLETLSLPDTVTTIGQLAFNESGLRTFTVPAKVAALSTGTFGDCASLTTVTLPAGLTAIGDTAFAGCVALQTITLPEGLKTIGMGAFYRCTSLSAMVVPSQVTKVGRVAFFDCTSLSQVTVENPKLDIGDYAFGFYQGKTSYEAVTPFVLRADDSSTAHSYATSYNVYFYATGDAPASGGGFDNPFVDVPQGSYYENAVLWAVKRGVTNGTDATHFSPENSCTRAEIVTFLWRAAGEPSASSDNPFVDVPAGAYYETAVRWAVENGITTGKDATHFDPDATCTRAEAVTFLWRAAGKPTVETTQSQFTDVAAEAYYRGAVAWAVDNSITNGITATTFCPGTTCTRAQIVTFLYRNYRNMVDAHS